MNNIQDYLKSMYKSNDKCMYFKFLELQDDLNNYIKHNVIQESINKYKRLFEFNNIDITEKSNIEQFLFDEIFFKFRNKMDRKLESIKEQIDMQLRNFYRSVHKILNNSSLSTNEMERKIFNEYHKVQNFFEDVFYYDITKGLELFDRDFETRFNRIYEVNDNIQYEFKKVTSSIKNDIKEDINRKKNNSIDHIRYNFKQGHDSLQNSIANIRVKPVDAQKNKENNKTTSELKNNVDKLLNELSVEKENDNKSTSELKNNVDRLLNELLDEKDKKNSNEKEENQILNQNSIENSNKNLLQEQKEKNNIVNEINPKLLQTKLQFANGSIITFKQYLEEFFAPFMPQDSKIKLSNGTTISRKQYIEEFVFSNATKYNRNVEKLISDTTLNNQESIIKNKDAFKAELNNMMNIIMSKNIDVGLDNINEVIDQFINEFRISFYRIANHDKETIGIVNDLFEQFRNILKQKFEKMINNLKKANYNINKMMIEIAADKSCNFEPDMTEKMIDTYSNASDLSGYSFEIGTLLTSFGGKLATELNIDMNLRKQFFEAIKQQEIIFDQKISPIFNKINELNIKEMKKIYDSAYLSNDFIKYNSTEMTQDEIRNVLIENYKQNDNSKEVTNSQGMSR